MQRIDHKTPINLAASQSEKKKSFENLWTFFAIPIGKIKITQCHQFLITYYLFHITGNWRDFKANPVAIGLWIGLLQRTEGDFWLRPDDQGLLFPSQGFMKFESYTRFIKLKCELGKHISKFTFHSSHCPKLEFPNSHFHYSLYLFEKKKSVF